MDLRELAAKRCDTDRVLEQPARIRVVRLRGREATHRRAHRLVGDNLLHERPQTGMRDVRGEELEEPVQLRRVSAHGRRQRSRIGLGRLQRTHVELQPVAEPLNAAQNVHGVALREPLFEELHVGPNARLDPPARIDELQRQVRSAGAGPAPLLACDGVDPLDDPVLGEGCDRAHGPSLGLKPDARLAPRWPKSSHFAPFATATPPARSRGSSPLPTTSSRPTSERS